MTIREIANAVNKDERTVQRWIKKSCDKVSQSSGKMSQVYDKMAQAYETKSPADYTLDETCFIIEIGLGKNAAALFRENAKQNEQIAVQDEQVSNLDEAFKLAIINMSNLAQSLANKTDELDKRISKIETQTEQRKALLPPPQIKPRDHINMIVRKYVQDTGVSHTDAWGELYRQFYYRTKTNAKVCAKNRGMGTLDYIESEGMIEILEAIAIEFFKEV